MNPASTALEDVIPSAHWIESLSGLTPERIVTELLAPLRTSLGWSDDEVETTRRAILGREREATTGIGNSVAIPHMKACPYVDRVVGVFGRSPGGIEWSATDGAPAHLFFLILTPEGLESSHIQVMRKIVSIGRDRKTVDYLRSIPSLAGFGPILQEADAGV